MAVRSIFSRSEGGVYVDGVKSWTFTLDVGLRQACVLLPFLSFFYMIWIDIHSRVDKGATVGSCRINPLPFCRRFGIACIFPSGSSTCTRSVFCCVRPNRNENQHWISTCCFHFWSYDRENTQAYVVCLFIHAVGKVFEKLVGQKIVAINKKHFFLLMHGKSWLALITQQMLDAMKHWMYCRFRSY